MITATRFQYLLVAAAFAFISAIVVGAL